MPETTIPQPGQVWKPTKPGSGSRIVTVQRFDATPDKVAYRTPSGLHRRITLIDWQAWVDRWECEIQP